MAVDENEIPAPLPSVYDRKAQQGVPQMQDLSGMDLGPAPVVPQMVQLEEGSLRPRYASGLSPKFPITESPLSVTDRGALSKGNDAGRMQYLKERYEDVQKNENGDYVIKKDGLWHLANGKAFDNVDSWTATKGIANAIKTIAYDMTLKPMMMGLKNADRDVEESVKNDPIAKEIVSEYVSALPTAINVGTSMLGGGVGVLGKSAIQAGIAAVNAGIRTSMGRAEGTFEGGTWEQAKDVGLETVLAGGGTAILLGAKPTAHWVGTKIPEIAQAYKAADKTVVDGMKSLYQAVSGRSANAIDTMMEHAPELGSLMKSVKGAASDGAQVIEEFTKGLVKNVKTFSETAEKVAGDVYKKNQAQLLDGVDNSFLGNFQELTDNSLIQGVRDGLVSLERKIMSTKAGSASAIRRLSQADAVALIAKNNGAIPKGYQPLVASREAFEQFAQKTGNIESAGVALDDTAHNLMKDFYSNLISLRKFKPGETGAERAQQVLEMNRQLSNLTYKIKARGEESALNAISTRMAKQNEVIKEAVAAKFDKAGLGDAFNTLNTNYAALQERLAPITRAAELAKGPAGDKAYEQLANQLVAKPGKQSVVKNAYADLVATARDHGSMFTSKLAESQKQIRLHQAAIEFTPWASQGLFSTRNVAQAGGMALIGGQPLMAAGMAATAAARSPQVNYRLLNATWDLKQMLNKAGSQGAKELLRTNPAVLNGAIRSVLEFSGTSQAVKDQLLSQQSPVGGQ